MSLNHSIGRITPGVDDLKLLFDRFDVSRETVELLQVYADLLVEWQSKANLVSNATLQDLWRRHICDSIQCVQIKPEARRWVDMGSGAGFPGLVIAILLRDQSDLDLSLIESNQKKCAFLRKVVRETGAKATVLSERIESVTKQSLQPAIAPQIVTARALASLEKLFNLAEQWLVNDTIGLFQKGQDYLLELEICRGMWEFDLIKHPSEIEENSVLLEVCNLKKIKTP